jgi:hypothetical protein
MRVRTVYAGLCRALEATAQRRGMPKMKTRTVIVRIIAEYPVEVPEQWTPEDIEFHRNESSWCSDNAIEELLSAAKTAGKCLCEMSRFEYVGEVESPTGSRP